MNVRRYDLRPCMADSAECRADMVQDEQGEWVRYEDFAALATQLQLANVDAYSLEAQLNDMARYITRTI